MGELGQNLVPLLLIRFGERVDAVLPDKAALIIGQLDRVHLRVPAQRLNVFGKEAQTGEIAFLQEKEKPLPGDLAFMRINRKGMPFEGAFDHLGKVQFADVMQIEVLQVMAKLLGMLAQVGQDTDVEANLKETPAIFGDAIPVYRH